MSDWSELRRPVRVAISARKRSPSSLVALSSLRPGLGFRTQGGHFRFQTLELLGDGLKLERSLSAFLAQRCQLAAGGADLPGQPLRILLQRGQRFFRVHGLVARMPGLGEQLHGVAACRFQLLFGPVHGFGGLARLRLAQL